MISAARIDAMLRRAGGETPIVFGAVTGWCIRRVVDGETTAQRLAVHGRAFVVTVGSEMFAGVRVGSSVTVGGESLRVTGFPDGPQERGILHFYAEKP